MNGLSCGADIVVQSSHKTLSSLSQTAMLHLHPTAFSFLQKYGDEGNNLPLVERTIQSFFSMLTTTSPNALLLASLDATRAQMEDEGATAIINAVDSIAALKKECKEGCFVNQLLLSLNP